jgi:hypothetical protein
VSGFSFFEEKKAISSVYPFTAPMATSDSQGPGYGDAAAVGEIIQNSHTKR